MIEREPHAVKCDTCGILNVYEGPYRWRTAKRKAQEALGGYRDQHEHNDQLEVVRHE